jgi:dienelactone hydrolase
MFTRRQMLISTAALPLCYSCGLADDPTRIRIDGDAKDYRLNPPKTLNDYFPFKVPGTLGEWETRKTQLREQILVANGLWPLPEKTPLKATIHGKIEREGYTIEKVYFASMPGHYVTGNLYRPTAKLEGKRPAILSPHGHWANGRLYTAPDADIKKLIDSKAETTEAGARHHLQARCAGLAQLGFVVFHYDMVGYADSVSMEHRKNFQTLEDELRGINLMGLQTWNAIRGLDFLESLPDVDAKKLGVTGASGGGTQTFIVCAIDDRPAVAFPAVMVSAQMQGGCVCENCSGLRVNTGNVEIAAMFAPKPMAMSCADDWTKQFLKDGYGLPELKKLWGLYQKPENVEAKAWLEYGHNYNQHAREFMYSWFLKHLMGKDQKVEEPAFVPVPPKELSVFDENHPRPKDEKKLDALRKDMIQRDELWIEKISGASSDKYREMIRPALRAIINSNLPKEIVVRKGPRETKHDGFVMHRAILGRENENDAVPTCGIIGPKFDGSTIVIWAHPKGKASLLEGEKLTTSAKALVDAGYGVIAPDVLGVGEQVNQDPKKDPFAIDKNYAGLTFGYNRTLLANRVHDLLTTIAMAKYKLNAKMVHLVGWGEAGPWAILAKGLAGDAVEKTATDLNKFDFEKITSVTDPMMLPGAVKYYGMGSFVVLCSPGSMLIHNCPGVDGFWKAMLGKQLTQSKEKWSDEEVIEWLVK